jgi:hypothetical protein
MFTDTQDFLLCVGEIETWFRTVFSWASFCDKIRLKNDEGFKALLANERISW